MWACIVIEQTLFCLFVISFICFGYPLPNITIHTFSLILYLCLFELEWANLHRFIGNLFWLDDRAQSNIFNWKYFDSFPSIFPPIPTASRRWKRIKFFNNKKTWILNQAWAIISHWRNLLYILLWYGISGTCTIRNHLLSVFLSLQWAKRLQEKSKKLKIPKFEHSGDWPFFLLNHQNPSTCSKIVSISIKLINPCSIWNGSFPSVKVYRSNDEKWWKMMGFINSIIKWDERSQIHFDLVPFKNHPFNYSHLSFIRWWRSTLIFSAISTCKTQLKLPATHLEVLLFTFLLY